MPFSQISWPFMAQAIAALLIAWNLKRKEDNVAGPVNGKRICDLHVGIKKDLVNLSTSMGDIKEKVAVIIERLDNLKEQVAGNKDIVTGQFKEIIEKLDK